MSNAAVKVDAFEATEKVKGGLSTDNTAKYYVWLELSSSDGGMSIDKKEELYEENTPIKEEHRTLLVQVLEIPGVRKIWVYQNALHVCKRVVADWQTNAKDGVHDQVVALLKKEIEKEFRGQPFEVRFIKGCEFSTTS